RQGAAALPQFAADEDRLAAAVRARRRRMPPAVVAGGLLVGLVVFTALLAPQIAPYAPDALSTGARLEAPSAAHLFGTDAFGRDLFSRVVYGARLALRLCLLSVAISALPGTLLGMLAGFYRGWLDQ